MVGIGQSGRGGVGGGGAMGKAKRDHYVIVIQKDAGGPLKIPVKVGYRFWRFWGLIGGPKSTQIGGLMGGLGFR
jgi:hypothetical protein